MVLLLAVARLLGTEAFGRYAALLALLAFVQLAVELGQEPVLVRLLAQRGPAEAEALVRAALAMRLVLASAGAIVLVGLGRRVVPDVGLAALVAGGIGVVGGGGTVLRAVFRVEHRLEWLCVVALANVATFGAGLAVAHALSLGLAGAVAAWAGAQLATTAAAVAVASRSRRVAPRWSRSVAAALARSGWAIALNAVLLTVTLRVGQLIVLRATGAVEAGYLAAGSRLAEAFALLPEASMLVLLPVLSAFDASARDAQRALGARVVRWLGVLALAVVVAVSCAAPILLAALFGAPYEPATPALRISIWLALLAATGAVLTNVLLARGLERVLLAVNAVSSIATIVASILVVPRWGFRGAAAVSLAANVLSQALLAAVPATRADVLACVRPLVAPIAIALLLALGAPFLGGASVAVAVGATAVFVVGCVAVGALRRDDVRMLREALARRAPVD